jgi:hypothetical protein
MHVSKIRPEQLKRSRLRLLPLDHEVAEIVDDANRPRVESVDQTPGCRRGRGDGLVV